MNTIPDEFNSYIEELFQAQFEISETIFSHQLEKGQTREGFIRNELERRFKNINVIKGFITGSSRPENSNQIDILVLKNNAQMMTLGENCFAEASDVSVLIEVKSNATGTDLTKFNNDIQKIKDQNPDSDLPLFGIFCYRVALLKKNILKRFGFNYDAENDLTTYNLGQEEISQGDFSNLELEYPNIDFILTIHRSDDGDKFIYLQKAFDRFGKPYYVERREVPVSKHLWNAIQGRL